MKHQKTFFVLKEENTCFDATLTNARGSGYTVIEFWAASNGGFFMLSSRRGFGKTIATRTAAGSVKGTPRQTRAVLVRPIPAR